MGSCWDVVLRRVECITAQGGGWALPLSTGAGCRPFAHGRMALMATWRRRALELFPDLEPELNRSDYTIYGLFRDLSSAVGEAHRAHDDGRLANIYGFAEWCARQRSEPLWNAAGVSFYEHVFDDPRSSEAVAPWLPADIRAQHLGLWEAMLEPQVFAQVNEVLAKVPPRRS
jgi:hypothetical protein